jgi:hypothetical protein
MVLEIPLVGDLSRLQGNTLQVRVVYMDMVAAPKAVPGTMPVVGIPASQTISILLK